MTHFKKPLASALGAAFLASSIVPVTAAGVNPFSAQPLSGGYDLASFDKDAEGSCGGRKGGEGSCGGKKGGEGSCGGKKGGEGSCGSMEKDGEGSCGGKKDAEGSCGSMQKDAESSRG